MHYYKFNIADWNLHTSHLTLEEEAVYFKLINYYYDSEAPIPEETQTVIRRLRLGSHEETVRLLLKEFFVLEDSGWVNKRCDEEIKKYHQKADRNKSVGKLGGRPKKNKELEDNPEKTQTVSKKNPQKTLTKNQEPRTNNQLVLPTWLPEKNWNEWLEYRRSAKKPMSELAMTKFINQLQNFVNQGYDPIKLIDTAIASSWATVYARDDAKKVATSGSDLMKGVTYART